MSENLGRGLLSVRQVFHVLQLHCQMCWHFWNHKDFLCEITAVLFGKGSLPQWLFDKQQSLVSRSFTNYWSLWIGLLFLYIICLLLPISVNLLVLSIVIAALLYDCSVLVQYTIHWGIHVPDGKQHKDISYVLFCANSGPACLTHSWEEKRIPDIGKAQTVSWQGRSNHSIKTIYGQL